MRLNLIKSICIYINFLIYLLIPALSFASNFERSVRITLKKENYLNRESTISVHTVISREPLQSPEATWLNFVRYGLSLADTDAPEVPIRDVVTSMSGDFQVTQIRSVDLPAPYFENQLKVFVTARYMAQMAQTILPEIFHRGTPFFLSPLDRPWNHHSGLLTQPLAFQYVVEFDGFESAVSDLPDTPTVINKDDAALASVQWRRQVIKERVVQYRLDVILQTGFPLYARVASLQSPLNQLKWPGEGLSQWQRVGPLAMAIDMGRDYGKFKKQKNEIELHVQWALFTKWWQQNQPRLEKKFTKLIEQNPVRTHQIHVLLSNQAYVFADQLGAVYVSSGFINKYNLDRATGLRLFLVSMLLLSQQDNAKLILSDNDLRMEDSCHTNVVRLGVEDWARALPKTWGVWHEVVADYLTLMPAQWKPEAQIVDCAKQIDTDLRAFYASAQRQPAPALMYHPIQAFFSMLHLVMAPPSPQLELSMSQLEQTFEKRFGDRPYTRAARFLSAMQRRDVTTLRFWLQKPYSALEEFSFGYSDVEVEVYSLARTVAEQFLIPATVRRVRPDSYFIVDELVSVGSRYHTPHDLVAKAKREPRKLGQAAFLQQLFRELILKFCST